MFGYRALRLGSGFILGVWLARHLGPEDFGILGYSIALVAMINTIAGMGIWDIVVSKVVQEPSKTNSILGAALCIHLTSGLIGYAFLLFIVFKVHSDNELIILVASTLGLTIVLSAHQVIKMWLEASHRIRHTAWVDCCSYLLIIGPRLYLLIFEYPVVHFAWLLTIESLIATLVYGVILARTSLGKVLQFKFHVVKEILKESWPLLGAALSIVIYMKIDLVMLGNMSSSSEVGYYAVAAKISEIFFLVPTIISAVWLPSLAKLKSNDAILNAAIQKILDYFIVLSLFISFVVSVFSIFLIDSIFGADFSKSSEMLAIHIWSCPLVFIGIVGGKWYVLKGLQTITLFRTCVAAVVNVFLNFLLIPDYGGVGAAVATLIAHLLADYLLDVCNKNSRALFRMKTKCLLGVNILSFLWSRILAGKTLSNS